MPHRSKEELVEHILEHDLPAIGSVWKHYKGELYKVRGTALEEATERVVVIYNSDETILPIPWTRPLEEWHEKVEHEGTMVQRFTLQG